MKSSSSDFERLIQANFKKERWDWIRENFTEAELKSFLTVFSKTGVPAEALEMSRTVEMAWIGRTVGQAATLGLLASNALSFGNYKRTLANPVGTLKKFGVLLGVAGAMTAYNKFTESPTEKKDVNHYDIHSESFRSFGDGL